MRSPAPFTFLLCVAMLATGCAQASSQSNAESQPTTATSEQLAAQFGIRAALNTFDEAPAVGERVDVPEEQWESLLTDEQFRVLRRDGTEYAHSHALNDNHFAGTYRCAGCAAPLYSADNKFDSGTGWPSFYQPIEDGRVGEDADGRRTEIHCASCGGHLGHVFSDGPEPTGLRHCVNGTSLVFEPAVTEASE